MPNRPDVVTLLVNGMRYAGWQEITIDRGIDRCVSSFSAQVTERWAGQETAWQIQPFEPVELYINDDLILTGYVESYAPSFDARAHSVRVAGHSKTKDLVDCTPDIRSGQFSQYTLAAIAPSICGLFGIDVVVKTDLAKQVVPNATIDRCETAFTFLERLGRLCGVLLTDDEQGRLVLTTAGSAQSSGRLEQGGNILGAQATINVGKRFSDYIVKGQAAVGYSGLNLDGLGGIHAAGPSGAVQTQMHAVAHDAGVPRYRPRVTLAESQLTLAGMQLRANWQRQYAYGQATKAQIRVPGFRQPDGRLWQVNEIVPVAIPWLEIESDLLIARLKFTLGRDGHVTELDVGPVEGYTPDPGQVRPHKHRGRKGHGGINLDDLGGVPGTGASNVG